MALGSVVCRLQCMRCLSRIELSDIPNCVLQHLPPGSHRVPQVSTAEVGGSSRTRTDGSRGEVGAGDKRNKVEVDIASGKGSKPGPGAAGGGGARCGGGRCC